MRGSVGKMVMGLEYTKTLELEILLKWSKEKHEVSFQLTWGDIIKTQQLECNVLLKAKMV